MEDLLSEIKVKQNKQQMQIYTYIYMGTDPPNTHTVKSPHTGASLVVQ